MKVIILLFSFSSCVVGVVRTSVVVIIVVPEYRRRCCFASPLLFVVCFHHRRHGCCSSVCGVVRRKWWIRRRGFVEGATSDCTILYEKTAICDNVCRLPSSTTVEAIHFTGKVLNLDCLNARPSIEDLVAKKKIKCIGMSVVLSTIRFPKERCMTLDDGQFVEVTIGKYNINFIAKCVTL